MCFFHSPYKNIINWYSTIKLRCWWHDGTITKDLMKKKWVVILIYFIFSPYICHCIIVSVILLSLATRTIHSSSCFLLWCVHSLMLMCVCVRKAQGHNSIFVHHLFFNAVHVSLYASLCHTLVCGSGGIIFLLFPLFLSSFHAVRLWVRNN